jgi:hypothetical protein
MRESAAHESFARGSAKPRRGSRVSDGSRFELTSVLLLIGLLGSGPGCGLEPPTVDWDDSNNDGTVSGSMTRTGSVGVSGSIVSGSVVRDRSLQVIKPAAKVTVAEVTAAIARHRDTSKFHHGLRSDGQPLGTWISGDGDRSPLFFEKDGRFRCGFLFRNGRGRMAVGRYAISENGLVVAVAASGGARLWQYFRLEDGKLIAPRGPNPRVEWARVQESDRPR